MKSKLYKAAISVFLCVMFCLQPAVFAASAESGDTDPVLEELIELYIEYSINEVTREEAIASMLSQIIADYPEFLPYLCKALLSANDRYGGYYTQTELDNMLSAEIFTGYGIQLDGKPMPNGYKYNTVITRVFSGSPAEKAGLQPRDEIVKIGGVNVENLGMNAVSHLLSASGSTELTVKRYGEELTVSMNKSSVYVSPMQFELFDSEEEKTALITITTFTDVFLYYDLYMLLSYLDSENYENIIIDLRGNTGGRVDVMLECLNMFAPVEGTVLCSLIYRDGTTVNAEASDGGYEFEQICVLVNGRSASAAETFALSLSEIAGAKIIGEKTYGKGVGQDIFELENGDMALFTTFEIMSPNGTKYNQNGLEPDILIRPEYFYAERTNFGQLNFVTCRNIKKDADNKTVLALNQRLAAIGYILPEDVTSKCGEKTVSAVEIFQKYNNLPVGITKIDYLFLDRLNSYIYNYAPSRYQKRDVQFECAYIYINQGEEAAREFAGEFE